MPGSRNISDADRKIVNALLNESGRTISNADRAKVNALLNESSRNISDADREMAKYMKRNDGGIASKTRVF